MKPQTRSIILIIINIVLVTFEVQALYSEYKHAGKFQWVDPNAIEDYEEFYDTPILFVFAVLGLLSILREALIWKEKSSQNRFLRQLNSMLKSISYLYGSLLVLISLIFIIMVLLNMDNHDFTKKLVPLVSSMMLISTVVGLFGAFIIYHTKKGIKSN